MAALKSHAESEGISTTELHLRGKVHNPENEGLCEELWNMVDRIPELQLPGADALQVPVRSNKTGKVLSDVSLSHELLESTLVRRCEWCEIVDGLSSDLSKTGDATHTLVMKVQ